MEVAQLMRQIITRVPPAIMAVSIQAVISGANWTEFLKRIEDWTWTEFSEKITVGGEKQKKRLRY